MARKINSVMVLDNLAIIVAVAKNGAIGKKNELLWNIPEDMKYFKEITTGHTVIMGWNTWLSLPKRPLPNRKNIVLSSKNNCLDGCIIFRNVDSCLTYIKKQTETCFIIGGESIYKQFIKYCNKLYISWIDKEYNNADVFFPIREIKNFKLISEKQVFSEKANLNIRFTVYKR